MEKGKACALDGLYAEHLLFAGNRLPVLLTLFLNLCISHGYLPSDMISTVLIPLLKDKSGNVTDKGNYRPIALSSVISKVFEHVLLGYVDHFMFTTDNQFGFKSKHSTDQCIYILKEVIDFYKSHNSPMFLCYMDASKAFDRINHWTLFRKLLRRGIPPIFVRIIVFWYRFQTVCVKWGQVLSPHFKVLNGVRQGGILSPRFYNVYIDDLSLHLSSCNIGCVFGSHVINHISYADDLIILCPSAKGLQSLITICQTYGNDHDINFNLDKTVGMLIQPKNSKIYCSCDIFLNGKKLRFVNEYKYLGIIVISSFYDDNDIMRQMRSLYIRGNFLSRNFMYCSDHVKSKLFLSFCSNMYCSHLWSSFKKSSFNKVRVAYNNCFRMLFKLPRSCSASHMFVYNSVLSFGELLRKSVYNFILRVNSSHNYLVTSVAGVTYESSHLRKHWRDILYTNLPRV